MINNCQFCQEDFVASRNQRKYCSKECSVNGQRLVAQCKSFNITIKVFFAMLASQDNRCGICRKEFTVKKFAIHIDHNHSTGKIRGLLCRKCNLLLGHAKDDKRILNSGIRYLNQFSKSV